MLHHRHPRVPSSLFGRRSKLVSGGWASEVPSQKAQHNTWFLCSFTLKGCRGKSEMFPMLAGNWLPNYLNVFLTLLSWWSTACGLFLLAWYQSGLKAVLSCAGHSHGHRLRASSIWPYVPSSAPVQNFFLRKEKEKTQCWLSVITSDHGRAATGSEEQVGSPKSMPHNVSVAICLMLFIFFRICQKKGEM